MKTLSTRLTFTFILLVLVSLLLFTGCQAKSSSSAENRMSKYASTEQHEPETAGAVVKFEVTLEPHKKFNRARLWLPYPVSNEYQEITDVEVTGNYDRSYITTEKKYGNHILYAEWNHPDSTPAITLKFTVNRSEIWRKSFTETETDKFPVEVQKFLASSDRVPCTGEVGELAKKITMGKKTTLEKVEAIYDYIVENFRRDDTIVGCGLGDVNNLINTRAGKCADIHSVFVALARASGVPAKEVFGIRFGKDAEGDITGSYHCISFFYLPDYGWIPIDASDVLKLMLKENLSLDDEKVKQARFYYFGAQTPYYIEFGTGRDIVLNPPQDGEPLNYFMYPYAEIDGEPLYYLSQDELKYSVTYKKIGN